jgi:hypothetical protein
VVKGRCAILRQETDIKQLRTAFLQGTIGEDPFAFIRHRRANRGTDARVASITKQPGVMSRSLSAATNSRWQPSWDQLGLMAAMVGVGRPFQRNR